MMPHLSGCDLLIKQASKLLFFVLMKLVKLQRYKSNFALLHNV